MTKLVPLSFLATIAPMQSAIKVGDDGMRISLDIAESELANAIGIIGMRNCVLKIEISKANNQESVSLLPKKSQILLKDNGDQ